MSNNQKPENGFINIIFNILIPVFVLNKGTRFVGPLWALVIALAFPLGYGAYDLIKRKKPNALSLLGLINVSVTGSLALLGLHGIWFAIKEAAFPLLVGAFVFASAFSKKPFIETLLINPQLMNIALIEEKLRLNQFEVAFKKHLKLSTQLLSLSFVMSATINFILARRIFVPIDATLEASQQSVILNEQIATMTSWAMAVVMIPSMIFLMALFTYLIHGIKKFTGLTSDEIMQQK